MSKLKSIEEAIAFKLRSAHYHKIMSERSGINKITNYERYNVSAMEFTAMMNTLHSILDLLAQWINEKHDIRMPEYAVSFKNIMYKVNDVTLKATLKKLKEDAIYLDDFCNYSKHRNIIRVKQQWYFASPNMPAVSQKIESFKKSKITQPEQSLGLQRNKQVSANT